MPDLNIWIRARNTAARLLSQFSQQITAISTAFLAVRQVVGDVVRVVGGAARAFADLTRRGGEVINVQRAFAASTENAGLALDKLKGATAGLISDFDLMVQFNRAVQLGAVKTADEFAELTRNTLILARAQGLDLKFGLESAVIGLARLSPRVIDNLGIQIKLSQATERYAERLGKQTSKLSENEKAAAFRTEVLELMRQKVEQLGDLELNAADNLTKLNVGFSNLRDRLAEIIASSPKVASFFDTLIEKFKEAVDLVERLTGASEELDLRAQEEAISQLPLAAARALSAGQLREQFNLRRRTRELQGLIPGASGLARDDLRRFVEREVESTEGKILRDIAFRGAFGFSALGEERIRDLKTQLGLMRELLETLHQIERLERLREATNRRIAQLQAEAAAGVAPPAREPAGVFFPELIGERPGFRPGTTLFRRRRGIQEFAPRAIEFQSQLFPEGPEAFDERMLRTMTARELAETGRTIQEIALILRRPFEDVKRELEETAPEIVSAWSDIMAGLVAGMIEGGNVLESILRQVVQNIARQFATAIGGGGGFLNQLLGGSVAGLILGVGSQLIGGIFGGGDGRARTPVPVTVTNRVRIDRRDETDPVLVVQIPGVGEFLFEEFQVKARRAESKGGTIRLPRRP